MGKCCHWGSIFSRLGSDQSLPFALSDSRNQNGKLRLMYENNPLAFIVENAGGAASDGRRRILDIKPTSLHQRVPLFIGSRDDVRTAEEFLAGMK